MLKEPAGSAVVSPQANGKYLEHQYCEITREVYQTIHTSGLYKFTWIWTDSLWKDMEAVVYDLDRLPEAEFKALIEVILVLSEARNELRLARFLFDVQEINHVHRLIMRNRAVLRCERILDKVIRVWPLDSPSEHVGVSYQEGL
jgi:hypothetical protein